MPAVARGWQKKKIDRKTCEKEADTEQKIKKQEHNSAKSRRQKSGIWFKDEWRTTDK